MPKQSQFVPIIGVARLEPFFEQIRGFLNDWQEPTPPFNFRLGWSDNYDALLRGEFSEITGPDKILKKALNSGRVLISGRGGAAKTTIVYRLARELLNTGEVLPVIINLKTWRAPFYEEWKALPEDFSYQLNMLLDRFAVPRLNLSVLESIDPEILKALIVDGLNELTPMVAQQIISSVDDYIRRAAQSVAIVTDRIVRRSFSSTSRWHLGSLLPLSEGEVRQQLSGDEAKLHTFESSPPARKQLLCTPLFLDQFLKSPHAAGLLTTAAELDYYFRQQIGLGNEEILKAASAAFSMYREQGARTFPVEAFRKIAGAELTEKLISSGAILTRQTTAYFSHHLHHDYLASVYLRSYKSEWSHEGFDTISFKAASFDAIALALQQLTNSQQSDHFIQALYDWNVYAPAYALAEAHHGGFLTASREMQVIIYAMLAEKRWDILLRTAERATDALAMFPAGSEARTFLEVPSLRALLDYVNGIVLEDERFNEWKSVFGLQPEQTVSDTLCQEIISPDSIIGWTLANVLKRTRVDAQRQQQLRSWARSHIQNGPVLWRIAHVLGTYPTEENVKFLLELFDNHQMLWPRYGALRALIEIAARSEDREFRLDVFRSLQQRVNKFDSHDILAEFERAIFVRNPPEDWTDTVLVVLNEIYERQGGEADRKRWLEVAQKLAKRYRPSFKTPAETKSC